VREWNPVEDMTGLGWNTMRGRREEVVRGGRGWVLKIQSSFLHHFATGFLKYEAQ
jgi:hypothetical protein